MALAKLCCMLQEYPFARQIYGFRFKAFIVDHRAREGSTEEANIVKDRLSRMGNTCAAVSSQQLISKRTGCTHTGLELAKPNETYRAPRF